MPETSPAGPDRLLLIRHGETTWSADGRHTGLTDVALTERGRAQAASLAPLLAELQLAAVLTSPLVRAADTAALAGMTAEPDSDLVEWDYGAYEGLTTEEIQQDRSGWSLWTDGVPPGEAAHPGEDATAVGARCDRVLHRLDGVHGTAAVVAHGHLLRVLAARWLGLPAEQGRLLTLGTTARCWLGHEHGLPVVEQWNLPAPE